ncbi:MULTISPECIES: RNA-binding protein [Streptomyces]|uniref:RNA-binding protein n=1 Tax=Streptomyces dengpaensis TaxID=2049881 RepID=A0ABM6SW57_9ACTN|nr:MULTISPECIES: RNA-binding protein [Streptomyces]AVH58699.1 RNA-binding protein [Streptomyces dengpaensis]PIB11238.1 hypothetical protein B1C81_05305 [Streptomyces sp. HG99]
MDEYALPTGPEVPAADRVRQSWAATVAALPVGARIEGEVIGRQRFGVFIQIDGMPEAVGLAEVGSMPHDMELPAMGAEVTGTVVWHADHNHQVKIKLDEWDRPE